MRPRRPLAVAEPRAVNLHALALIVRCVTLAGRELVAARRCAPAKLDAVVRVVRRLEGRRARRELGERQLFGLAAGQLVGEGPLVACEETLSLLVLPRPQQH